MQHILPSLKKKLNICLKIGFFYASSSKWVAFVSCGTGTWGGMYSHFSHYPLGASFWPCNQASTWAPLHSILKTRFFIRDEFHHFFSWPIWFCKINAFRFVRFGSRFGPFFVVCLQVCVVDLFYGLSEVFFWLGLPRLTHLLRFLFWVIHLFEG